MAIETRTINGTLTEAYTSVEGSYMTQAKATHFHDFWTRKILAPTESIDDFKEVTASEKAKLEAADAAWERPPQVFIDAWNARADFSANGKYPQYVFGKYNEETGYFELNTILDIDYVEAQSIMQQSGPQHNDKVGNISVTGGIRTLMPIKFSTNYTYSLLTLDISAPQAIEILQLFSYYGDYINVSTSSYFINGAKYLRTILGAIRASGYTRIHGCPVLENVKIVSISADGGTISFHDSPLLSLESINYTIDNSTKTLTIILHADAYARVTDEMFEKAAAKNITITSA